MVYRIILPGSAGPWGRRAEWLAGRRAEWLAGPIALTRGRVTCVSEQRKDVPRAPAKPASAAMIAGGLVLDVICVIGFAASGRSQHGEAATFLGLWQTAWPFLAGLALLWVVALVWRRPFSVLRSGLPVWLGTVGVGMVLRVYFTDGGAALPFVLVATGTLGLTLIGWRLLAALLNKIHRKSKLRTQG